jgi:hypothetical protein
MSHPPLFWVSETYWYCHMCTSGPHIYAITTRCTNILSSGHLCQHEMCSQCNQLKMKLRRTSGNVGPSVPNTSPSRLFGGTDVRTTDAVDSRIAWPGREENQDSNGGTSSASAITTGVPEGNSNTRELTTTDTPVSDSEISSDESPQVTPLSDTSSEDGTMVSWQADLNIVSAVASRLVHDWASQYRTPDTGSTSNVRTHAGGSRGSEAPYGRSQRNSANPLDAASTPKRSHNPDSNNDDTNDQSRKRRRQELKPDPDKTTAIVRLLACPFCKYDPQRYSERNVTEKEYRGCSSCYLADINRMK